VKVVVERSGVARADDEADEEVAPRENPFEPHAVWYWPVALLLCLLALAVIWVPAFVPGQDTPVHTLFARVLRERGLFAGLLEGRFAPTSQLSVYLSVPFASLEPALVGKLTRTLAGGLLLGAMLLCGRETGERRPIGFLLAPALTCAFPQAMGFDNFALGMALGVLAIAATLRALAGRKIWYLLGLMVAGMLLAVAHAVAFGLTAVVAGMLALLLATDRMSTRLARVGLTVLGFLPGGLYAIWATLVVTATQTTNGVAEGLGVQRLALREQVTNLWDVSFGGFSAFGLLPVAVAFTAFLLHLRGRSEGGRRTRLFVGVTTVVLLGLYFAVPFHIPGWAYAQPRVLAALFTLLLPFAAWGGTWRIFLPAYSGLIAAFLGASLVGATAMGEEVRVETTQLGRTGPGLVMPAVVSAGRASKNPYVSPLQNAAYYALWDGGALPEMWVSNPAIHAVYGVAEVQTPPAPPAYFARSLACDGPKACEAARRRFVDRVATQGVRFERTLLVGADEAMLAQFAARGFKPVSPGQFRSQPGSARIRFLIPAEAAARPVSIRLGYTGSIGWFAGMTRPPSQPPVDGMAEVRFDGLPAGVTQLMITLDASKDAEARTLYQVEWDQIAGREQVVTLGVAP
jgi:hypothetical protein